MTPLEMIAEWRRGCSCATVLPGECAECTQAMVDALERELSKEGEDEAGTRYRLERIAVKTTWNYAGQIEQLVEAPSGIMQRRVLNTMERQVREALIANGWTPPTPRNKK